MKINPGDKIKVGLKKEYYNNCGNWPIIGLSKKMYSWRDKTMTFKKFGYEKDRFYVEENYWTWPTKDIIWYSKKNIFNIDLEKELRI